MKESVSTYGGGFNNMATQSGEWSRFDRREKLIRRGGLLLTGVLAVLAWIALDVTWSWVLAAPREISDMFARMWPPDIGYTAEIVIPLIDTIHIAVLGTAAALILAGPVAYIGAENTTLNRYTLFLGKFIISATRSVNVIIWALFFVIVFGPGVLAGVFAVAFRSIGFCAKLLAEAIEEINPGPVEAMEAAGANYFDQLIYAIVPQIKPAFVGVATYRWDINVRSATVLGLVGAGGIGQNLDEMMAFFAWDAVLTILLAILVVVIFSEGISAYSRKKVS